MRAELRDLGTKALGVVQPYGILVPRQESNLPLCSEAAWSLTTGPHPRPGKSQGFPSPDTASDNWPLKPLPFQIPQEGLAHVASTVTLKQNSAPVPQGMLLSATLRFPQRSFKTRASAGVSQQKGITHQGVQGP